MIEILGGKTIMFISENLSVNEKDHLVIGGCDTADLINKYNTPLYVMDEELIKKNCKTFKNSIDKYYNGNGLILYASKAFSCKYMCNLVKNEGLGLDVVSGGELYTAVKSGFPTDKIYFHGNNKTYDEILLAIDNKINRFVVDNIFELDTINKIAKEKNIKAGVLFRIKPGIDAHTHDFIKTGQIDSKFGFALETGEAMEIIKYASKLENIDIVGVHCHIGSQIFELEPFVLAAKVMMNFIGDIKDAFGIEISELNLGGGFGIKYTETDCPIEYDKYIEAVSVAIKEAAKERNIKMPFILMEPGRSLIASAGITLYTVGGVKDIPNIRKYVSVDGGMCDNPRYILYQAKYSAVLSNRVSAKPAETVTIAGKCCESGDILITDIKMPQIKVGDNLAVLATGAYNYSMSSNYNRIPRPPVIMAENGKDKLIIKRETYDDIIANDL